MALVSTDPEDSGSTDGGPREEQTGPADQITEKTGTKVASFGDEKKIQRRQAKTWRKYERELRCILKAKRRLGIALDKDGNDMDTTGIGATETEEDVGRSTGVLAEDRPPGEDVVNNSNCKLRSMHHNKTGGETVEVGSVIYGRTPKDRTTGSINSGGNIIVVS